MKDVFGIVGSAFMVALDLFPAAGIRFLSVQHEQNAVHMADGYSRINGEKKQGRIHDNPVTDGWAGAVMRKPLGIQKIVTD